MKLHYFLLFFSLYIMITLQQEDDDGNDKDPGCDLRKDKDNIERCPGMSCDANYMCYSNICNKDLICAEYLTESRFNGIVALIGFLLSIAGLVVIGFLKLCRNRITRETLREKLAGVLTRKQEEAQASVHKTGKSQNLKKKK